MRSFSSEAAELFHALQTSNEADAFVYVLERLYHLLLVDEKAALSELRDRIAQAGRKGEFGQLHALARIPAEHVSTGRLSSPATQWADVLLGYSLAVAGEYEVSAQFAPRSSGPSGRQFSSSWDRREPRQV